MLYYLWRGHGCSRWFLVATFGTGKNDGDFALGFLLSWSQSCSTLGTELHDITRRLLSDSLDSFKSFLPTSKAQKPRYEPL